MREPSVRDLMLTRLQLRPEVRVTPVRRGGETTFRLQLPTQGRFFEVGVAEYTLFSFFDGNTSLAEALTRAARRLGREAFDEADVQRIFRWLLETDLAVLVTVTGLHGKSSTQSSRPQSFNPLWLRFPLLNPDHWIQPLAVALGWCLAFPSLLVACALWLQAGVILLGQWPEFQIEAGYLLVPDQWLWLASIWIVLKTFHELGHAVACRSYGVPVREFGLYFMLLAPVPYVDVTNSWSLSSRWQRMWIAAAGMYMELTIAAVAVWGWSQSRDPEVRLLLHQTALLGGVSTLLFNANPLMRFDGYYLLSDWLGITNLAQRGERARTEQVRRFLFGSDSLTMRERGWIAWFLLLYGWLAAVWRVGVLIAILVAAAVLFEGAGIILAFTAGALLMWGALRSVWRTVQKEWRRQPGRCLAGLGKGLCCGLLVMAVMQLPWPGGVSAPGIVEFRGIVSLRSEAPGFITSLTADAGEGVSEGRVVVQLENRELQLEASRLELSIQQSESRRKGFLQRGEIGAAQVEARHQQALQEQLQQHLQELASLELEVPHADGVVVTRRLQARLETYIPWGQEIAAVGQPGRKDFEVLLDQTGWELAQQRLGQSCGLYLPGVGRLEGRIVKVDPRATLRPQQLALTAAVGGPLPVRNTDSDEAPVLAEPRFQVTVELSEADSLRVAAGQRGVLLLGGGTRPLLNVVYQSFRKWLWEKWEAARGQPRLADARTSRS